MAARRGATMFLSRNADFQRQVPAIQRAVGKKDPKPANDYYAAFKASLSNPLYTQTAKSLGIKNYNSVNDYTRVLAALSGGAGSRAASNPSKPASTSSLPRPNDGSYANIIANVNAQGAQGAAVANKYNTASVASGGNAAFTASLSNPAYQQAARQLGIKTYDSLKDYGQITAFLGINPATGAINVDDLVPASAPAPAPAPALGGGGGGGSAASAQMQMLNDLMIKQDEAYQQQLALQEAQIQSANAALLEQRRQADALSRAYVPASSATAAAPVINGFYGLGRNPNTLSSLSIMGGNQYDSTSLAGLQIA